MAAWSVFKGTFDRSWLIGASGIAREQSAGSRCEPAVTGIRGERIPGRLDQHTPS